MKSLLACAIVLGSALASPLHAETYKWVDEKGVTNYSSSPPPAKAAKAKVVEDRISVVPADPSLGPAIAAMRASAARRAAYAEAEWLQRQRYMLAAQQADAAHADCPYRADCAADYDRFAYPYYFVPVFVGRRVRHFTPSFVHRTTFSIRSAGTMRSARGSLR